MYSESELRNLKNNLYKYDGCIFSHEFQAWQDVIAKLIEQARGGAIDDDNLDMWTNDLRWALDVWGRRELMVWVIG